MGNKFYAKPKLSLRFFFLYFALHSVALHYERIKCFSLDDAYELWNVQEIDESSGAITNEKGKKNTHTTEMVESFFLFVFVHTNRAICIHVVLVCMCVWVYTLCAL